MKRRTYFNIIKENNSEYNKKSGVSNLSVYKQYIESFLIIKKSSLSI